MNTVPLRRREPPLVGGSFVSGLVASMADDVRLDLRGRHDPRKVGRLFSSGLVLMASQTDPLEVRVFVAAAMRQRDDVIDLDGFRSIADFADRISSEDLGAEFHPTMAAVRSTAPILARFWTSVTFAKRNQTSVSGDSMDHLRRLLGKVERPARRSIPLVGTKIWSGSERKIGEESYPVRTSGS